MPNLANIFGPETVLRSKVNDLNHPVSVNRIALGEKVFANEHSLAVLRSLVSPEIKKLMLEHFAFVEASKKYDMIAVEGAVLIEANTYPFFDELWVVTLPKDQAIDRVIERDAHLTRE